MKKTDKKLDKKLALETSDVKPLTNPEDVQGGRPGAPPPPPGGRTSGVDCS